jgi:hypothetical protein
VYHQGYPIYTISAQNLEGGQAKFIVNQTQSDPSVSFFEMPVPIRVFGTEGQQLDLVLNNTANGESFTENVPFAITSLTFDPNKNIISKNNTVTLGQKSFDLNAIRLSLDSVSNVLSLDLPNGIEIEKSVIYNMAGQKIKETSSATTWDITSLPAGVYFISVVTNSGKKKFKFVKS